jgi:hypothetical protein
MYKKITFFNCFHNGDIHVSRSIVKGMIAKLKQINPDWIYTYAHKNYPNLLADIPEIIYDPGALHFIRNEHDNLFEGGNALFVNTWYAQQQFKYMNQYGISFDALYAALNDSCQKTWGFSLGDISTNPSVFFPSIDYSNFYTQHAKEWLSAHPGKKIFICNGYALSGQSHNFPITPLVMDLARRHIDKTFILTNKEGQNVLPNVLWSADIIKKEGCDLNENAFLSEHCDSIIGRATGTFAFSETTNNMLNRKCKMLCFTNITPPPNGKFWLSSLLQDKIHYTADITVSNESNIDTIRKLIEDHI